MINNLINPANVEQKTSLRTVAAVLAVVFAATHGWALLSWNALYWDDWSILTSDALELHRIFKFVGFELMAYLHAWLVPLGAGAYKILMLCSLALMSVCVFLILRNYQIRTTQAGLITALFISAPFNSSKIAAINSPAVMFAAIFFLAWLLLILDLQKPSLQKRLSALALFSISFYLPSSLAFFALPAMSIIWCAYSASSTWGQRRNILLKRVDFLALPFIQFAIFRLYFFKPDASIATEYHQLGIRTSRLQEALDRVQADIVLDMPWAVRILLLVLPLLVLLRTVKHPNMREREAIHNADLWLIVGLIACFFALFPYLAVGRLPLFSDWNSRYQLFLPLGYALICWAMSQYLAAYAKRRWIGISVCTFLLILGSGFSVRSYFEYADDWRKQNQLIKALQEQKNINLSDNIVIVDSIRYAKRRDIRYNEYTQMMLRAYPGWRGIALSYKHLQKVGGGGLEPYITSLGGIANLQTDPRLFGLPSSWQWSNSCVVLVAFEVDGHIAIKPVRTEALARKPCVVKSSQVFSSV